MGFSDDLFEQMENLFNKISSNTDHREKCVGDKVKIWDGSANVDNKGKSRHGIDPLFKQYGIVSDINCNKPFLGVEDTQEILDIAIYFPDADKTVWTKSEFVQLSDFESE